ncbi:putative alpha/beta hydrolase [Mycobacterium sp. NPDC003323]
MSLHLQHLDVGDLTDSAGGDPWLLDRSIQAGAPGEISELATAFRLASSCTQETTDEFLAAKARFESAWDRQDGGGHPINDSVEVQRATESMNYNRDKLAKVAVDLQNIAASLAEAQRSGGVSIGNLEAALKAIDGQIDHALRTAAANSEPADVSHLRQAAVERTTVALREVQAIRDGYAEQLEQSRSELAAEGYSAGAMDGAEGSDQGSTSASDAMAERYDAGQRSVDQQIVNSPGPWTPEKQAAAGRLRDYATINDPTADIDALRYASQRLDDYHVANATGPMPVDPILGGDARSRAQTRLDWQQKLEQGLLGTAAMKPDQATEWLNQSEAAGQAAVLDRLDRELQRAGMSPAGAAATVDAMSNGSVPQELVALAQNGSKVAAGGSEAVDQYRQVVPTGDHWKPGIEYTPEDLESLKNISSKLGTVGNVLEATVAIYEVSNGAPIGEVGSKVGGGMAGTLLGAEVGAWAGSPGGPVGVFVGALAGGIAGSFAGEWAGQQGYRIATR